MALHKTRAIVLKSQRWGEADRIVTFYTLRFGKLRAVARGARRAKSQFGAALQPFVYEELNLFQKHGDSLYRLTQTDIREPFTGLREDLDLMGYAGRVVNLVAAITQEADPDPGVFETVLEGLRALQESDDPALTTLLFQVRLIGETGFRPQLDDCAICGAGDGATLSLFSARSGGLVCRECARRVGTGCYPLWRGGSALLRQAARMTPSMLRRLKATGQVRLETEPLVEALVNTVAGTRLPPMNFLAADPAGPPYGGNRIR